MHPEGKHILQNFTCLILDADGVWFDGKETRFVLPDGSTVVAKSRDLRDGQGLSFLRAIGIRILFATGEGEPLGSIVRKLNELPSVANGSWSAIELLANRNAQGSKEQSIDA